jgi:hypothetical protein
MINSKRDGLEAAAVKANFRVQSGRVSTMMDHQQNWRFDIIVEKLDQIKH